jgi:hypothetical protein
MHKRALDCRKQFLFGNWFAQEVFRPRPWVPVRWSEYPRSRSERWAIYIPTRQADPAASTFTETILGCIEKIDRALLGHGPARTRRPRISLLQPACTLVQLMSRPRCGIQVREWQWFRAGVLIVAITQIPLFGNKEAADQLKWNSRPVLPEEFDIDDTTKLWGC